MAKKEEVKISTCLLCGKEASQMDGCDFGDGLIDVYQSCRNPECRLHEVHKRIGCKCAETRMKKKTPKEWAEQLQYWIDQAKLGGHKDPKRGIVYCEGVDKSCTGCPHSVPHISNLSCMACCGVCCEVPKGK